MAKQTGVGIALSTAGVNVGWFSGTTKPTSSSSLQVLYDIKSVPSLNPEPNTLDSTVLAEEEYKTYIAGLKDLGGALSFTANYTNELASDWDLLLADQTTNNGFVWIGIKHPDITKTVVFKAQASPLGLPEMGVDAIMEIDCFLTPMSAPEWV